MTNFKGSKIVMDERFDRDLQAAREEMNRALVTGFERLFAGLADTFRVSTAILYRSPWTSATPRTPAR